MSEATNLVGIDFDLGLCSSKNQAYFEGIDFGPNCNKDVLKILGSNIDDITFVKCLFNDLDLSKNTFDAKITFHECKFNGKTNFSNTIFGNNVDFNSSTFKGITEFNNTRFSRNASFNKIKATPFNGGYFYFRGDEIDKKGDGCLYNYSYDFSGATFEAEVSFLGRLFLGNLNFKSAEFHNKFGFTNTDIGLKSNFHNVLFKADGIKDIDICYSILADVLERSGSKRQAELISKLEEKVFNKVEKDIETPEPSRTKMNNSELLSTKEAADYLGLKSNTLEKWRLEGLNNLNFIKIGRMVRYRLEDLKEYIDNNKR